jgi:membrane-associated protein
MPWTGKATREDKLLLAAFVASGILPLALLPLVPVLVSSHPALLELIRGSTPSIVNMGARARVGEESIIAAALLGVPSLMLFDWAFWWAGRRWGDRFGPAAVVLAYVLPLPRGLVYAAVGDGGMRLWVFLALDALGTLLWTSLLAFAGWQLGHAAVDIADQIGRYGLWATIGLIVLITLWQAFRSPLRSRS